jgi:predicted outer membrane protein
LIEELGEQHLQTARTFLSEKQDEEFDRCFVGMAIAGHMQSDDMLTVFERHASGELKSTIQEARRTVKQHLQAAKDLAVQIEGPATLRKER